MQKLKERKEYLNRKAKLAERNNDLTTLNATKARIDELERAIEVVGSAPAKDLSQGEEKKESENGQTSDSIDNLEKFTVDELKEVCRDNNISGYSGLNKDELIALISDEI